MIQNQTDYRGRNQKQYTPLEDAGQQQFSVIYKRIGTTNYRVRVHFSDTSTETVNDKILRLVKNEAVSE